MFVAGSIFRARFLPPMSDDPPQISLNLMMKRKRRAHYRLRRRRYLRLLPPQDGQVADKPSPEAPPMPPPTTEETREWHALTEGRDRLARELAELRRRLEKRGEELEGLKGELDGARERSEAAKKVIEESRHQVQRARSEMESQRKRLQREREELQEHAAEELLRQLLPILDNFDLALKKSGEVSDPAAFLEGMTMIQREFQGTLERAGLHAIEAEGTPFDPQVHEAITTAQETGVADGQVLRELRPGYRYRQKVLRPAMVTVNKLTETPAPQEGEGEAKAAGGDKPADNRAAHPLRPKAPPPRQPGEQPPADRPASRESTPLDDAKRYLDTNY